MEQTDKKTGGTASGLSREVIMYLIFGVLTTIVSLVSFWPLQKSGMTKTELGFTAANAICWIIAVTFAYVTNRTFVFENRAHGAKSIFFEAVKFYAGRLFSGMFEIILPAPVARLCGDGISEDIAGRHIAIDEQWMSKFIVMGIVIVLNYLISKFVVFTKKDD